MKEQTFENKMGEIKFKQKLYKQQIGHQKLFDDEFDSDGIEKILLDRMSKTTKDMAFLKKKDILTPYIEIGAERGQRSLVMENEMNCHGASADLSYEMLLSADYYARKFGLSKVPLRVCCDAYNLPFASNSLPFVFCYETLHHFPNPVPIIKQIRRVLSPGGVFFFDEEPCRGILQLKIFKSKNKIYSKAAGKRRLLQKLLEYFLYDKACNETDYGILENDKIPLRKWQKMFDDFEVKEMKIVASKSLFKVDIFPGGSFIKRGFAHLFGGILTGFFKKSGILPKSFSKIEFLLICPQCATEEREYALDCSSGYFLCPGCKREFRPKNGVLFLFSDKVFEKLYSSNF